MSQPIVVSDDHEECEKRAAVVAEALVRVTEERDEALRAIFQAGQATGEYLKERDEERRRLTAERDEARRERDEWEMAANGINRDYTTVAKDLLAVRAERDEARDEVDRKFIEIERLTEERNAAIARNQMLVASYTTELESQASAFREERETLNAELIRLRTIIGELGAAEAAEPPEGIEALRPGGAE